MPTTTHATRSEAESVAAADRRDARRLAELCRWALRRLADGDARPRHLARQLAAEAGAIGAADARGAGR